MNKELDLLVSRRRALILGTGAVTSILAANSFAAASGLAIDDSGGEESKGVLSHAVQGSIEEAIQAKGKVSNGLFSVTIDRNDITGVKKGNVPIKPAFQINGQLYFQDLGGGRAIMNGDFPLKASELNGFIDQLLAHNIVFQAEHQHMYDFAPIVWFIHFRASGDAVDIARGMKAAFNVTSTPFPQSRHPIRNLRCLLLRWEKYLEPNPPWVRTAWSISMFLARKRYVWVESRSIRTSILPHL